MESVVVEWVADVADYEQNISKIMWQFSVKNYEKLTLQTRG